jgi:hypothetical protein
MKRLFPILILFIFLSGCGPKAPNLPQIKISGTQYPGSGMLIYQITDETGKDQGKESIAFNTKNDVLCLHSSTKVTTVCLNKNSFSPVSETARFIVNKVPSDVNIDFFPDKISVKIQRQGKIKKFYLKREPALYPDDALDFVLQGMDFSQKDVYLYDYFPYTSLKYICEIKNLGREKIKWCNEETEIYHIIVDFGKKHRDLYFAAKSPHLLIKRQAQGVTFTLIEFKS